MCLGSGSPGGGFKTGCFVGGGMAGGMAVFGHWSFRPITISAHDHFGP